MLITSRNRIALLFVGMFFSSVVAGLCVGIDLLIDPAYLWVYATVSLILYPHFLLFNSLDIKGSSFLPSPRQCRLLSTIVFLAGIGSLISALAFLFMMKAYANSGLNVSQFKNGGYSKEYIDATIPFIKYNFLLLPFGYLSLGIHFSRLIVGNIRGAYIALWGSASLFLTPLMHLSRGGVLLFFLLYIFYFLLIRPCLEKEMKRRLSRMFYICSFSFACAFFLITNNRFREGAGEGIIDNPLVYSIFNYMSQWMVAGVEVIKLYTPENSIFASSFLYLPNRVMRFFGTEKIDFFKLKLELYGDYGTSFVGLPATLVYDFGSVGAIVFSWSYYFAIKHIYHSIDGVAKIISFSLIVPTPLFFFQGAYFVSGSYNIAILYFLLLLFFYTYSIVFRYSR